eukprot:CAMPEP_0203749180 /NCGR_PEP_ID=MMETSP0098-20131031/3837_1 /ASSEMBLY_ACC=CAM_ASM_000208 /TAXON_ID=96639 /ORGANISM=" , Strain NY0313808BC1" /LENGTH=263 /DNA_ID=CAMNT_0050638165 /DNA_START=603 /DNA_END=1391 /DNA_ORIENTATION=+
MKITSSFSWVLMGCGVVHGANLRPDSGSMLAPQSVGWVPCAHEDNDCGIPSGTHWVRFGNQALGYYYKEFTNPTANFKGVPCDRTEFGGDPSKGSPKQCAYQLEYTGDKDEVSFSHAANENGRFEFRGVRTIRFGSASNAYSYREYGIEGEYTSLECKKSVLGNPANGYAKHCRISPEDPKPFLGNFTQCAAEGHECSLLPSDAGYVIRYGTSSTEVDNRQYTYRYVDRSDGVQVFKCDNDQIKDPTPGSPKEGCAVMPLISF